MNGSRQLPVDEIQHLVLCQLLHHSSALISIHGFFPLAWRTKIRLLDHDIVLVQNDVGFECHGKVIGVDARFRAQRALCRPLYLPLFLFDGRQQGNG